MSLNPCRYLTREFVGRFHAAICRCDNDRKCPRKHRTTKCQVNISCFNLRLLNNREVTETIEQRGTYGTGEPNAVNPAASPASPASPDSPSGSGGIAATAKPEHAEDGSL